MVVTGLRIAGRAGPGLPATVVSPQAANPPPPERSLAALDWSVLINTVCLRSKGTASPCTLPDREVPRCNFPVADTQIDYAYEELQNYHCTLSRALRSQSLRPRPMAEKLRTSQ